MTTFTDGIAKKNPVFFLLLGMCPTLAITTSVENAIGMALATIFVLVSSGVIISAIRKWIPEKVRIPCFIVIIAATVTIAAMFLEAYAPTIFDRLGIYVPLIVVNCIVLGRALAFAYKNPVNLAFLDSLGMGIGFAVALLIISTIRELLGAGQLFGMSINPFQALIFVLPPGALLVMGLILGFNNWRKEWKT